MYVRTLKNMFQPGPNLSFFLALLGLMYEFLGPAPTHIDIRLGPGSKHLLSSPAHIELYSNLVHADQPDVFNSSK
jgi:hypothetical protein